MVSSPDGQKILVWNKYSTFEVYEAASLSYLGYWTPPVTSTNWMISVIEFSADSSLALVETGRLNPVAVVNLTDLSTHFWFNFTATEVIRYVSFLNSSSEFMIVVGN